MDEQLRLLERLRWSIAQVLRECHSLENKQLKSREIRLANELRSLCSLRLAGMLIFYNGSVSSKSSLPDLHPASYTAQRRKEDLLPPILLPVVPISPYCLLRNLNGDELKKGDDLPPKHRSVGLIIGLTGITGNSLAKILLLSDTPGRPWKVYGVARSPRPVGRLTFKWNTSDVMWEIKMMPLLNFHVLQIMLRNVLAAAIPNSLKLRHICLQTGRRYYPGLFETSGMAIPYDPPLTEDLPRFESPNFYYAMEDILREDLNLKEGLSWSIH
ncbi:3-oxo-Delta(4,5)-steroid 5-beta-reductase-like protein [Drosera capensis]